MTTEQTPRGAAKTFSHERSGYTLVELMVSMGSASVLMAGLASCIYVASLAFDEGNSGTTAGTRMAADVLEDVMADIHYALDFSERQPNSVTFTVPDRDGDANPETLRYAWSGTQGDPLTLEHNGGPPATIVQDVQQFNLNFLERAIGPSP